MCILHQNLFRSLVCNKCISYTFYTAGCQFTDVYILHRLAFRKLSSIYVFSYFPFGFEDRIWDLIVSVPDHCLSFYFVNVMRSL